MIEYYVMIGSMLVGCIVFLWAVQSERREWNNGICRKNGQPWRSCGIGMNGDREYEAGRQICFISYHVDKGEVRPELVVVEDERSC